MVGGKLSVYSALPNDCDEFICIEVTTHKLELPERALVILQCVNGVGPFITDVAELERMEGGQFVEQGI